MINAAIGADQVIIDSSFYYLMGREFTTSQEAIQDAIAELYVTA